VVSKESNQKPLLAGIQNSWEKPPQLVVSELVLIPYCSRIATGIIKNGKWTESPIR